jgi:hypothetical protein
MFLAQAGAKIREAAGKYSYDRWKAGLPHFSPGRLGIAGQ